MPALPADGLDRDEVLARLEAFRVDDLDPRGGRTWAYVYDTGRAGVDEVGEAAYVAYLHENALDPTVFPSLMRMENEVVGIVADHLRGGEQTVGSFTSGGTESCMLAVKAARDRLRAERGPGRVRLVAPVTAHAAFHKAADYFDLELVTTPVDPATFRAEVDAIAEAIDERTALVVASAPSYAHGVVDPVAEIAALAAEHGVACHVDACVGGWLLPHLRRLGRDVPDFDLSVPGVTSISVDLHKYAYCPKGASLVLHRDPELRRHQLFACASWTGYTMLNPTIQSSKSGGALAAAWATLHHIGDDGYLDIARRTAQATDRILQGVEAIDHLRVLGSPDMSMVAVVGDGVDVFDLVDRMRDRGWYVQPQLSFGPSPANLHLSVTAISAERAEPMLADLAEACREAVDDPAPAPDPQLLEALAALDPADLTPERYAQLLDAGGLEGGRLPERMAQINAMLDAMRPQVREQLLRTFLDGLARPVRPAVGSD